MIPGKAKAHPAYDSSLRHAVVRAYEDKGMCYSVYYSGGDILVQKSEKAKPKGASLICIAQYSSRDVVELRFSGGYCEWMHIY